MPEVVRGTGGTLGGADSPARRLVERSDTFFIATAIEVDANPRGVGADVSHRGGAPGFVAVSADGSAISWPDYIGNFMFNTIGNLTVNPRCGLLFIDFETGDLLQLTGRGEVLHDVALQPGALRTVGVTIDDVRFTRHALPLRWTFVQASPFNPAILRDGATSSSAATTQDGQTQEGARTVAIERIDVETDAVKTYWFAAVPGGDGAPATPLPPLVAGQYGTFELALPDFKPGSVDGATSGATSGAASVAKPGTGVGPGATPSSSSTSSSTSPSSSSSTSTSSSSSSSVAVRTWTIAASAQFPGCLPPPSAAAFAISVKRLDGGSASVWLFDHARIGDRVVFKGFSGTFVLSVPGALPAPTAPAPGAPSGPTASPAPAPTSTSSATPSVGASAAAASAPPLLLLAGGIGVTPIAAILRSLACEKGRLATFPRIDLLYGARNASDMPFQAEFAALAEAHPNIHLGLYFSRRQRDGTPSALSCGCGGESRRCCIDDGRVDAQALAKVVAQATPTLPDYLSTVRAFVCGPQPFMDALADGLGQLGVPAGHITMEAFTY